MDSDNVAVFGQHGFADTRYFSRFDVPAIEFGPTGLNGMVMVNM